MLKKVAGLFILLSFLLAKGDGLVVDLLQVELVKALNIELDQSADEETEETKLAEFSDELTEVSVVSVPQSFIIAKISASDEHDIPSIAMALSAPPPDRISI